MNDAEKKFLYLALFLFALGGVSRLGLLDKLSPLESISLPVVYESVADTIPSLATSDETGEIGEFAETAEFAKPEKTKKPKKKAPEFPLSINTASKDDLCFIKGVGPSLAQKIIDYRETKGSFRSAKDLEKVSGVGAKKRQAIEEFVKFD
jgi:competence protein ComEA